LQAHIRFGLAEVAALAAISEKWPMDRVLPGIKAQLSQAGEVFFRMREGHPGLLESAIRIIQERSEIEGPQVYRLFVAALSDGTGRDCAEDLKRIQPTSPPAGPRAGSVGMGQSSAQLNRFKLSVSDLDTAVPRV
jgi:hypothetical protein